MKSRRTRHSPRIKILLRLNDIGRKRGTLYNINRLRFVRGVGRCVDEEGLRDITRCIAVWVDVQSFVGTAAGASGGETLIMRTIAGVAVVTKTTRSRTLLKISQQINRSLPPSPFRIPRLAWCCLAVFSSKPFTGNIITRNPPRHPRKSMHPFNKMTYFENARV